MKTIFKQRTYFGSHKTVVRNVQIETVETILIVEKFINFTKFAEVKEPILTYEIKK